MQLEDYFDFQAPNDIRIKGHRIGIEHVLYEYIHRGRTPDEILTDFPTIALDEVHATILYYLRNREAIDKYMADWIEHTDRMRREQPKPSADFLERVRKFKAEQAASSAEAHA